MIEQRGTFRDGPQQTHKLVRMNERRSVLVSGPLGESLKRERGQSDENQNTSRRHYMSVSVRASSTVSRVTVPHVHVIVQPTYHASFTFMSVLRCISVHTLALDRVVCVFRQTQEAASTLLGNVGHSCLDTWTFIGAVFR